MCHLPTSVTICTITSPFRSFYVIIVKDVAFYSIKSFLTVKRGIVYGAADIR